MAKTAKHRKLRECIVKQGAAVLEAYASHPHPWRNPVFAEIYACLDWLTIPVEYGAGESSQVSPPGVFHYPYPVLGIGTARKQYFITILDSLRDAPGRKAQHLRIANQYFTENQRVVNRAQDILARFYQGRTVPEYVRLVIRYGDSGEGYISPVGAIYYQRVNLDWQITWIEAFNRELKHFRRFLEEELLHTCTEERIDMWLAEVDKKQPGTAKPPIN